MTSNLRIAADIGGTFTDIAMITREGHIATRKVLSTSHDYAEAVLVGIRELMNDLHIPVSRITEIIHGCTVATNAILENKGAKTALLTTKGFRDVLELRRIRMPTLYDLNWVKPAPLVPRRFRYEVDERLDAEGKVVRVLDQSQVKELCRRFREHGIESIAVCFLHSYANPEHEKTAGEILRKALPDCFISLSIEVLPEIREYERTSTTVINAYLGPPVKHYMQSLINRLHDDGINGHLLVMQSSGGVLDAGIVMERPAEIVECGPAAGVIGAAGMVRPGLDSIITFDMGGTTAKASIIEEGRLVKTDEYEIGGGISLSSRLVKGGGYALKLPVIDISEVGAGGGSIVWFDKAGGLKVGPHSAGAAPGPVCYSLGGTEPTVTDANVVLGYINPCSLAGGTVPVDAEKAREVIRSKVAERLGQDILEAAYGVHTISNSTMMRAIKAVSTYRGRDPRDFTLFAYGGNGGVHASELAVALGIKQVVCPPVAGVFSALGLLLAPVEMSRSRTFGARIHEVDPAALIAAYEELKTEVAEALRMAFEDVRFKLHADLRYSGQAYELTVPLREQEITPKTLSGLQSDFEAEHLKTYGHQFPEQSQEIVTLRVIGSPLEQTGDDRFTVAGKAAGDRRTGEEDSRPAYFGPAIGSIETPVYRERTVLAGGPMSGPMIIEEYEGTIVVNPLSTASLDEGGNVVIDMGKGINQDV
jgi:N-methylhydantoinase A